ncbi:MAG: tyrosine-type recombinase/integrase [Lachnospiraceae bacterium]|nr:tyrosine-type recombinase/integrase [Lachnospiraceae bacterium]
MKKVITSQLLENYRLFLNEQEKSKSTIQKYMSDLNKLTGYADGRELTKMLLIEYKDYLRNEKKYKTSSINSYLVAANRFFDYMEWYDLKVKPFKVQKEVFVPEDRELSKEEYKKLLWTAAACKKTKIGMVIQTICATGIRISELSAITVPSIKRGVVFIYNKGKERQVLLSRDIQLKLLQYIRKNGIKSGAVFQTISGKPLDRTYVWREMKKLCDSAGVNKSKVFPHNLRHLFARTFYNLYKDIAKLADILGHSNIETTRIYIRESGVEYMKQLNSLKLVLKM